MVALEKGIVTVFTAVLGDVDQINDFMITVVENWIPCSWLDRGYCVTIQKRSVLIVTAIKTSELT
jgi:hypothetical protein